MRKLLISILLASAAATPALAAPRHTDRDQAREERSQAARPPAGARAGRPGAAGECPAPAGRGGPARPRSPAGHPAQQLVRAASSGSRTCRRRAPIAASSSDQSRGQRVDQRQRRRSGERRDDRQLRQSRRQPERASHPCPGGQRVPRPGTQPPLLRRISAGLQRTGTPTGATATATIGTIIATVTGRCSTSAFTTTVRLGLSALPIGWRLWPGYYSSHFWINDPWQYRLPYAPPGTQWVRYYDDAVLVDMWSGQVEDVISTSSGKRSKAKREGRRGNAAAPFLFTRRRARRTART